MAACATCRGRLCELGLSCPRVTLVLPEKPDKGPQGEFAPGGSIEGLQGVRGGSQGGKHLSQPQQ